MKNLLLVFFFVSGFSLTSCSQYTPVRKVDSVTTNASSSQTSFENEVLALINQYRLSKRLTPLKVNNAVLQEARKHSADMASKKVAFSHDGFQERSNRIYAKVRNVKNIGENVAYGQLTAKEVVQDWISSPGHRKNIEGNFTETGVGIVANSKGVLYYTQIFIR